MTLNVCFVSHPNTIYRVRLIAPLPFLYLDMENTGQLNGVHFCVGAFSFVCSFVCLFVLLVTRFLPCLPSLALLTRHTALNSHLSLFIIFTYFVSVFAVKPRSYRLMTFTDVFVISLHSSFFKALSSSLLSLTDSLQHMQPLPSLSFSLSRTHTHTQTNYRRRRKEEGK